LLVEHPGGGVAGEDGDEGVLSFLVLFGVARQGVRVLVEVGLHEFAAVVDQQDVRIAGRRLLQLLRGPGQRVQRALGDDALHELVGDAAVVGGRRNLRLVDLVAVQGGDDLALLDGAAKPGDEPVKGVAAAEACRPRHDERDHAQDGQAGEDDLGVFPEAVKGIKGHVLRSSLPDTPWRRCLPALTPAETV
jgi:hypothetical protein